MYPLPETHVSRCVSAMFQSADSWHFVLCFPFKDSLIDDADNDDLGDHELIIYDHGKSCCTKQSSCS